MLKAYEDELHGPPVVALMSQCSYYTVERAVPLLIRPLPEGGLLVFGCFNFFLFSLRPQIVQHLKGHLLFLAAIITPDKFIPALSEVLQNKREGPYLLLAKVSDRIGRIGIFNLSIIQRYFKCNNFL